MKARKQESEPMILVRVKKVTKLKVERYLVGRAETIGEFFSKAAEEQLRSERLADKINQSK